MPAGAAPPLRAMLADPQTHQRQIKDLPGLLAHQHAVGEIATAALTARREMPDDLIRALHPL